MPKKILKAFKCLSYGIYLFLAVGFLLELSYRYYVIDFYRPELEGLNATEMLRNVEEKPLILALGDSFTADPNSYVRTLRQHFSNHWVLNSGVPGTCLRQATLMAPKRIEKTKPEVLIYQIYMGNDLLEFRHPTSSKELSWQRRCYWWLADRIQVLGFLNFRLKHLNWEVYRDLPEGTDPKLLEDFSVQNYSARTKMYFRAEPHWIENAVGLKKDRETDARKYLKLLNKMLARVPDGCKVVVMVIPHCMQVHPRYRDRMLAIGALLDAPEQIHEVDYPFVRALRQSVQREDTYVFNALPFLQEAVLENNLYYENDPHLNPLGQEVLGKHLIDFLAEEAIFEKSPGPE